MITHFSNLELNTVSIQGVKQFYHGQLKFSVIEESKHRISFKPTDHFTLTFNLVFEPISPVHIAFEVPFSRFQKVVTSLNEMNIPLLKWDDGRVMNELEDGKNVYFRDGDGNLLEIITHDYIKEEVIAPQGILNIFYIREIGFPVQNVTSFREWLVENIDLKTDKVSEHFAFAISGTAHCVITSFERKWIPISMLALPPKMKVTLGVTDIAFIESVQEKLNEEEFISNLNGELHFKKQNYYFILKVTDFNEDIPRRMNLPYSRTDHSKD